MRARKRALAAALVGLTVTLIILLEQDVPLQLDLTDVAATPTDWPDEIVMRATSDYGLGAYRVNLASGRAEVLERYSPLTMHMLFDEAGAPVLELKYDRKQHRYVLMSRKDGVEQPIGDGADTDGVSPLDWAGFIDGGRQLDHSGRPLGTVVVGRPGGVAALLRSYRPPC